MKKRRDWESWDDEQLLDLRLGELDLRTSGCLLQAAKQQLHAELRARKLLFRPVIWLSDDWFTPEGVPGFAVPFYLAHPRLIQLELDCVGEVEGGTLESCLKILRHETGHAIDHAYGLRRKRERQTLFGLSTKPYPTHYSQRPFSRSHVRNLEEGYAQSHPDEDFAETFAVWLDPRSRWRNRYRDWPALKKLVYIDGLMKSLRGVPQRKQLQYEVAPLRILHKTLRQHYRERQSRFLASRFSFRDASLLRIFSPQETKRRSAASFLCEMRRPLSRSVSRVTGEYQYTVALIVNALVKRSRELNLRLIKSEKRTKSELEELLAHQTSKFLRSERSLVPL